MADKAEKKIDPFDVAALEKSLNDSATRVSTIWVSFLIFGLYLLTAAATVTHRQLFLAEPVKLPVLNIELPLWGFFFLAPILFVIFHAYVLIQVILLARTAAAYNEAVRQAAERDNLSAEANASLRQRLANTLFAQILAGSPREREGGFGKLLNFMAWITLAIAPILILLTFQFAFLPYHSHLATWAHRLLILLEFALAFRFWPLVFEPQRDFHGPDWRGWIRKIGTHPGGWLKSRDALRGMWQGMPQQAVPLAAGIAFVAVSLSFASFPGEPHVNLLAAQPIDAVQCDRWIQQKFDYSDLRFDRLVLARVDIIDDERLDRIVQATAKASQQPFQGERTRVLRDRDFNCGDFSDFADLRRVDLRGSRLMRADFRHAKLGGASLDSTQLQGASLDSAQLQGASLDNAQLEGAFLRHAQLQGASLDSAQLEGSLLDGAQLQGASLLGAQLQGASLENAYLQGASFDRARLQGASLVGAELQGASFDRARLQGASLVRAQLQGASFDRAKLEGASFDGADNVSQQEFDDRQVAVLRGIVCDAGDDNGAAVGGGIVRNWISRLPDRRREFSAKLARALLGEDGKPCAAAPDYDGATKKQLRAAAGPPPAPASAFILE